jgi:hypothetical protein
MFIDGKTEVQDFGGEEKHTCLSCKVKLKSDSLASTWIGNNE